MTYDGLFGTVTIYCGGKVVGRTTAGTITGETQVDGTTTTGGMVWVTGTVLIWNGGMVITYDGGTNVGTFSFSMMTTDG
jgi:hypothetical protein